MCFGSVELERHGWLGKAVKRQDPNRWSCTCGISILWNTEPNQFIVCPILEMSDTFWCISYNGLTFNISDIGWNPWLSFLLLPFDIKYLFYHPDAEDSWENECWITRPSTKPLVSHMDFQVLCSITSTESDVSIQITGKQKKDCFCSVKLRILRASSLR